MFKDIIKEAAEHLAVEPELSVSDILTSQELKAAVVLLAELFKVMEATSR